jgi:hypothetical protein
LLAIGTIRRALGIGNVNNFFKTKIVYPAQNPQAASL